MWNYVALLTLVLWSAQASADEQVHWCHQPEGHPVDVAFGLAMDRSGGVTADMRDAQSVAYAGWDAELNRIYRQLMQQRRGSLQADGLRQAQRAWLAWDKAETVSDQAFAEDQGTSGPLAVAGQAIERRRARACTLSMLLQEEDGG